MSLTFEIQRFAEKMKVEVCSVAARKRTAGTMQALADGTDGDIALIGGVLYEKDSTVLLADSVTVDLGIAGIKPAGETVTPAHFGGGEVGASKALNYTGAAVVDLQGYLGPITLTDTITVSRGDVTVKNMNFNGDISASTVTNPPSVNFEGSKDAGVALSADTVVDSDTIQVASATAPVVVDQWVKVTSDVLLRSTSIVSEMARVREVTGSTGAWVIKFYSPLVFQYSTSDNSVIEPVNMLENITIDGGKVSGNTNTDNQTALRFAYCDNLHVNRHDATDTDYAHVYYFACGTVTVTCGPGTRTGTLEGLDYGHVASVVDTFIVDGYLGKSQRHAVTTGSSKGVVRRYSVRNAVSYTHLTLPTILRV